MIYSKFVTLKCYKILKIYRWSPKSWNRVFNSLNERAKVYQIVKKWGTLKCCRQRFRYILSVPRLEKCRQEDVSKKTLLRRAAHILTQKKESVRNRQKESWETDKWKLQSSIAKVPPEQMLANRPISESPYRIKN